MSVKGMGVSIVGEGHVQGPQEHQEQKLSVKVKY